MKKALIKTLILTSSLNSMAALNLSGLKGTITNHTSPSGLNEVCVIPNKLQPNVFNQNDLDDENSLCSMDFYTTQGLCPKQNSTNPGTSVVDILSGMNRTQTMNQCKGPSDNLKVEAKFKSSISCSYTPSILAYYQFSRMFSAGRVPVAVLRTMDRKEHLKVANTALQYLASRSNEAIYLTWKKFYNEDNLATKDTLFDTTRSFVYGALSDNPKKEFRYTEVSGVGSYETRYQRFLNQGPYLKISSSLSVNQIAGSDNLKAIIPTVVQMKDVSDMVLLDTLFSQDDRIGNIHYKMAWYMPIKNESTGQIEIKNKKSSATLAADKKSWIIPEDEKQYPSLGGVLVKEILMKDNDCGVSVNERSNMMRSVSALEGIKHMSAKTYKKFMNFYKIARTPETLQWMKSELLFTDADLGTSAKMHPRSFLANLDRAYTVLKTNCKNGTLKLDLNLNDYVAGNTPEQQSCE